MRVLRRQEYAAENGRPPNAPLDPAAKPPLVARQDGADTDSQTPDRAKSYFHAAMADIYEEEAATSGRPEYVTHAIEEYKDALNADPGSAAVERCAGRSLLSHRPGARG